MPGRNAPGNYGYKYGFNGKENDNETVGTGEGTQDYGARIYNPALGRFLSVDPLKAKFAFQSPYLFAKNSPILYLDKDGEYAVSVHYKITYNAMKKMGYSDIEASTIAHFSSVYADHPEGGVLAVDNMLHFASNAYYKDIIDYSPTEFSQKEWHSNWHSMMSNAEAASGMTEEQAMQRGLEFGWENIFSQKDKTDYGKLGQGMHALQDAIAHKGAKTDDHLGCNVSSAEMMWNDIYGNTDVAQIMANSSALVFGLIKNDALRIEDGMNFTTKGMNSEQMKTVEGLLSARGYYMSPLFTDAWKIYQKKVDYNVEFKPIETNNNVTH